jgi:hypothetical protein
MGMKVGLTVDKMFNKLLLEAEDKGVGKVNK